jgi:hypothetical protein
MIIGGLHDFKFVTLNINLEKRTKSATKTNYFLTTLNWVLSFRLI